MGFSRIRVFCIALAAALSIPGTSRAAIYVAGDSLGVGVGWAGKAPSVAKNSVMIRSKVVLSQIARVPVGSTIFLSLGTNDAVGKVLKVDAAVQSIIAAANARRIRIVWLGPPCVFKPWDKNAAALDQRLSTILGREGITYVSTRDANLCTRSVRARDGVHFNMAGYKIMWDKAAAAALGKEPSPGPDTPQLVAEAVDAPRPRLRPRPADTAGPAIQPAETASPAASTGPILISNNQALAARFADAFLDN